METGKNKNSLHDGYLLHWYEIKSIIGRGGFGITYLAHDSNLDRYVAIKEYMPGDFASRESDSTVHPKTGEQKSLYEWGLERFIKEAQTLAKFNHPNIVRVLSVFEENNTAYMIMEYAQGEDLSTVYKNSPKFTEEQLLDTFIPIMDGLALVHNAGFIHRDIKPANIYICENNSPLLLDFGSARQSIGGKTKALTSLVTYGYAPFEQYNEGSGKQGPWTDIYSLGACIHVGITGQKPVDALQRGGNFLETGVDAYQPLSVVAKGEYSENFLLAIDNALMFKIDQRPQNILDWADMLLGKTQAPELPEYMFKSAVDDATVIQPMPVAKAGTAPSQGTQGLVDAHGKRNSRMTGTKIVKDRRRTTDKPEQIAARPDSNSNISGKRLKPSSPDKAKSWLFIAISSSVVILLIIAVSLFYISSSTPEATDTAQKLQLQNERLEQLFSNAEQALSQKKYIMPTDNNAYYFYQQALEIKPDNKTAAKGIKKIESQLILLARTKYDNGDMTAARQYLKQLDIVNPLSDEADKLNHLIQKHLESTSQINSFLNKADKKLNENEYTKPENDNAFYYYLQVLALEPNNQAAEKGINNIEEQLNKEANTAYKNKQYNKSLDYLAQLKLINPESTNAKSLENKINKEQSRESQIVSWLKKATTQKNNNYYTSPKNNNAFNSYNKILKLEPKNKQALDGLKNIQWHYKTQFNQHIAASRLNKAEDVISIMEEVSAPSSTIKQMQKTLKNSRQNVSDANAKTTAANKAKIAAANKAKKAAAEKIDIHQVSKKIGEFKTAIQQRNKNKIKSLSQYAHGREQFVTQLLSQYKNITVKISNLQLISKENQAKAQVELTDLVDINNKKITPGNWSKFEIIVRHNNRKQLKIHW